MNTFNWCNTDWMPRMNYGNFHTKQPWQWYDPEQVCHDGNELVLNIEAKPKNIQYKGKDYSPQLAVGTTYSVQTFGYGTFSAEIKLPRGKGLWPAFWLVGEGVWPDNGEMDICEAWTNDKGNYIGLLQWKKVTTNAHWLQDGVHRQANPKNITMLKLTKDPSKNFVKYEVEWRPDSIVYRANGKTVRALGYDVAKHIQGTKQHAVFDLWTTGINYTLEYPMMIRNFEYKPLEIL